MTREDKQAIDNHSEKISKALEMCMFESNDINRIFLVEVLTQSDNIIFNLVNDIVSTDTKS